MSHNDRKLGNELPQMLTDEAGTGAAMVLVGGGLTGSWSWETHQQQLKQSRRAVRAQLLSVQYGLEGRPLPEAYSVGLESAALARAVDALALDGPIDWVAWSYGALVTLNCALEHSERVRTLTLIEPPAFWVLEATETSDPASQREFLELKALSDDLRGGVSEQHLARFVRAAGLCPDSKQPEDLPSWPLWLRYRHSLLNMPAVFAHSDRAERLQRFDRPVLLVKGIGSMHSFRRIIDVLSVTLPHARTLELAGGHAAHVVELDGFLKELAAFQESRS